MLDLPFHEENGWPKYTNHFPKSDYNQVLPPFSFNDFYGGNNFVVYYSYPYYVHVEELDEVFIVTTNFKSKTIVESNDLRIIYPFPNLEKINID